MPGVGLRVRWHRDNHAEVEEKKVGARRVEGEAQDGEDRAKGEHGHAASRRLREEGGVLDARSAGQTHLTGRRRRPSAALWCPPFGARAKCRGGCKAAGVSLWVAYLLKGQHAADHQEEPAKYGRNGNQRVHHAKHVLGTRLAARRMMSQTGTVGKAALGEWVVGALSLLCPSLPGLLPPSWHWMNPRSTEVVGGPRCSRPRCD